MIGLGKMGANMTRRLSIEHDVVVYDKDMSIGKRLRAESDNIIPADTIRQMIEELPSPKVVWLMIPHEIVDRALSDLIEAGLSSGDIIVDGGNSNYKDSISRGKVLADRGIAFSDCGTSGGVWGLENGYSLMVGGSKNTINVISPLLTTLAANSGEGWVHAGDVGTGHFVKMIHNGIEYGMMQSIAEGFDIMRSKEEFNLNMHEIAKAWQRGSVISSWLLDLTCDALENDEDLKSISDWMDDSGEGRWTIEESIDLGVPVPVLSLALQMRFRSRQTSSFAGKVVNAQRSGFGGHSIKQVASEGGK